MQKSSVQWKEYERNTQIENENRLLFDKIENIMYRKSYKKQQSCRNPNKKTKIFFTPGDPTQQVPTFIPTMQFDINRVKENQRDEGMRQLHNQNQKVLNRIMQQAPT